MSNALITVWPTKPYFVYMPNAPLFSELIRGYQFKNGRIPGAVNGDVAEVMSAFGCAVVAYLPGMDIAEWLPHPEKPGQVVPRLTWDGIDGGRKAPPPKAVDPGDGPGGDGLDDLDIRGLRALCKDSGLSVGRWSRQRMINALRDA